MEAKRSGQRSTNPSTGAKPCQPRSSFPTTEPPTRTTRSPSAACSGARARLRRIVAVGDGNGGARATAEALAGALDGTVEPVAGEDTDLLVFDSRAGAAPGEIWLSSSAVHLMEVARSSVLVVPRGATLPFARTPAPLSA